MPNQPKTKNRVVRVPDELWDAARDAAHERGDVLSEVIRESLRGYVANHEAEPTTTYGAIARAQALVAKDPDWHNVTRWPRT